MTATAALTVTDLTVRYDQAAVLHGVSLTVAAGELVALLGRNGAGKSTTLKAIMGLVPLPRGQVCWAGTRLTGLSPHVIARQGVGWVPEDRRVFPELSVRENLAVGARPPGPYSRGPHWTLDRLLALFPALEPLLNRPAGLLSGGEQQMLTLARTLAGQPGLLLLDEPSEGLAPVVVRQLAGAVRTLKEAGLGILLSEQNLAFAGPLTDRVVVLEKGHVRRAGPLADLEADPHWQETWLGVGQGTPP